MVSFFVSLLPIVLFWVVSCSRPIEKPEITESRVPRQDASGTELLSLQSTALPGAVKDAAHSVFRLVVHWDTAFQYEKLSYAQSADYLQNHCSVDPPDFLQTKNCEAIRRCFSVLKPESHEFCYAPYLTGGSTWVAKTSNGRTVLVTNWHVFQRQFAPQMFLAPAIVQRPAAERKELLRQLEPIFSLFDAKGDLVYDSTAHKAAPRIVDMGDVLGAAFSEPGVQAVANLMEDYVAIEIPLSVGKPLEVASEAPSTEEPAFAVGYPVSTRGRPRNSDGHQLYFSRGHFYSPDQFLQLVEPIAKVFTDSAPPPKEAAEPPMAEDYVLPERGFIYSSCDVVGGNSGGPVLNGRGQVVGMVARSYSNDNKYEAAGSVSLFVPHLPRY